MSDDYFALSRSDRRDALLFAASKAGRPAHLIEKDVWVVWALHVLFDASFADALVFKGGTSLSKAYGLIARFSEDVDITVDIRWLLGVKSEVPTSASKAKRLASEVREKLPRWLDEQVVPVLAEALSSVDSAGEVLRRDGEPTIDVAYSALTDPGTGYVSSRVLLEFGARSSGEPASVVDVRCDAQDWLPSVHFPTASPRVMDPARTFWEKATAAHVYCASGRFRGGKGFARHWYDLARLWESEHGRRAGRDFALRTAVAEHKSRFFREKDTNGEVIDYHAVVDGSLRLVPEDDALASLHTDYEAMIADGMFAGEPPAFGDIIECCRTIEKVLNGVSEK